MTATKATSPQQAARPPTAEVTALFLAAGWALIVLGLLLVGVAVL